MPSHRGNSFLDPIPRAVFSNLRTITSNLPSSDDAFRRCHFATRETECIYRAARELPRDGQIRHEPIERVKQR